MTTVDSATNSQLLAQLNSLLGTHHNDRVFAAIMTRIQAIELLRFFETEHRLVDGHSSADFTATSYWKAESQYSVEVTLDKHICISIDGVVSIFERPTYVEPLFSYDSFLA